VEEIIKPLTRITSGLLAKNISRHARATTKKLSWVMKNLDEPFCAEFKEKFEANEFRSVKAAELCASTIYKDHCEDYDHKKATVVSVDGVKLFIKKRKTSGEHDEHEIDDFKRRLLNSLSNQVDSIQAAIGMDDMELSESLMQLPSEAMAYARNAMGRDDSEEIDNRDDQLCAQILSIFHKIITQTI
jgi:hypothetical protein